MSSKLHVCLFRPSALRWSNLYFGRHWINVFVLSVHVLLVRYSRRQYLFVSSWSYPTSGRQIFHMDIRAGWLPILLYYVVTIGALIHAGRGLRGTTIMCPQVLINGSPTFSLQRRRGHKRWFCKKQSIFRISESLFCVDNGIVRSKFTKIEIISVVLLF